MTNFDYLNEKFGAQLHTEHDPRWRKPYMIRIPATNLDRLDGRVDGATGDRFAYGSTLEEAAETLFATLSREERGTCH